MLQLSAWGMLKSAFGWQSEIVALADQDRLTGGALLLFRQLPFRLGTMAYLPMGPYITHQSLEMPLWDAIHATANKRNARFLKWEPGVFLEDQAKANPQQIGFRPSPQTIQPPRTILIDIRDDDDTILARMNQGTRRKIRQGVKKGVRFYQGERDDIARYNQMMQTTGNRNEFGVHSAEYYQTAYDLFVPNGDAALFMAEHDGDYLAGIMVFALGDTAWYLYGASSNQKRNLMATYGIQWQAIQWARSRGSRWYDMWGIPDEEESTLEAQFQDRNDGLWGVYGFKRGWGGRVARSLGTWDYVYNPLVYRAYQTALRIRG